MVAGNKFATMLSRNTSRITVVLVYVVLEWVLIVLLLLNSLFCYLIRKFVAYFGLKPPCPWCTRIDQLLESCREVKEHPFIESVCEAHAKEISRLGYCLKHGKLVEACQTCEDCSFARGCHQGSVIASVSLVAQIDVGDEGDTTKCSCCGAGLNYGFYSKYLLKKGLFKPAWDVLADTRKVSVIREDEEEEREGEGERRRGADEGGDGGQEVDEQKEERRKIVVAMEEEEDIVEKVVDEPLQKSSMGNIVDYDGGNSSCNIKCLNLKDACDCRRLVPVDVIDSVTQPYELAAKDTCVEGSDNAQLDLLVSSDDHLQKEPPENESVAHGRSPASALELRQALTEDCPLACLDQNNRRESVDARDGSDGMAIAGQGRDSDRISPVDDQINAPGTKGTITVEENSTISNDGIIREEPVARCSECTEVASSTSSHDDAQKSLTSSCLKVEEEQGLEGARESANEELDGCPSSETTCIAGKMVMEERIKQLSLGSEFNEIDEEREPEIPNHMDVFQSLRKRLAIEKKDSGIESLDGSVLSETEGGDDVVIEQLKAALKAERMAFNVLYSELEEERSASAIAANQTMAMITRLQEEKAAMQMEAVQYQRMMEEQSEYDQEALQLLNELMVKREKEKQELEKELELYRKKVLHYEARERRTRKTKANEIGVGQILNHQIRRTSSSSSSGGDSDELSADFNEGDDGFDTILESNQKTPDEAVHSSSNEHESTKLTTLDESLADFEQERLSILEKLKALEEKLLTLSDEESESTTTMNQIVGMPGVVVPEESFELIVGNSNLAETHSVETDGKDALFSEYSNLVVNGTPDHLTCDGKRPAHRAYDGPTPKGLLPLFVSASSENENEEQLEEEEEEATFNHSDVHLCKHVAIEEEVEQVYERLQALEADEEFLKHCVNSLKKGDKGMHLLQEILQHLRDLKAVELR